MPLLGQMIQMRQMEAFIDQFVITHNKEEEDKTLWEFWLHKVHGQSYDDFKRSLSEPEKAAPTPEEIKNTVKDSMHILGGFVPDERVGEQNDTVQAAGNDSHRQRAGYAGAG